MADLKQDLSKQVSIESSSSNETNQLKIDENEQNQMVTKPTIEDEEVDSKINDTLNNSSQTDSLNDSSSKKKRVDRGLDGGYWGSLSNDRKRRRTNTAQSLNLSRRINAENDVDDILSTTETSKSEVKANMSIKSERSRSDTRKRVLFKAKTFIAVRNDENGFFLCQLINPVYDDTQRCKIQWLEDDDNKNKYKLSFQDHIDQQTIITVVGVNRLDSRHYSIKQEDLDKVNKLLEQALKNGGIELDEDESESDDEKSSTNEEDISEKSFDSEETEVTKYKKRKISLKSEDPKKKDIETDEVSQKDDAALESKEQTGTKSHLDSVKQKVMSKLQKYQNEAPVPKKQSKLATLASNAPPKPKIEINKMSSMAEPKKKKIRPVVGDSDSSSEGRLEDKPTNISTEATQPNTKQSPPKLSPKQITPLVSVASAKMTKLISPKVAEKPKKQNENIIKFERAPAPQIFKQNGSPKSLQQPPQATRPQQPTIVQTFQSDLKENPSVRVYLKDPFYEDEAELPFVSSIIQSKLLFRAINLGKNDLLKNLIDNDEKFLSIHVKKSIFDELTPLKFAIEKQNYSAIELLLNNYNREYNRDYFNLCQSRFSSYFHQELNSNVKSSRKKEGLKAFFNDFTDQIDRDITSLIDFCLENNTKSDILDLIREKLGAKQVDDVLRSRITLAILHGHRNLVAHLINLTDHSEFTQLHRQVLISNSNDCSLIDTEQALVSTSHGITPIHLACLNPNKFYLKFLVTITKEYGCMDSEGRKPIHYAAVAELTSSIEFLSTRGQSLYEKDFKGNTPLHYACIANRPLNVDCILKNALAKQQSDPLAFYDLVNHKNKNGDTPLSLAIARSNLDVIKILFKFGVRIDDYFINAAKFGNQKIVQYLADNNALLDATDEYGRIALHYCAINASSKTLSFLLKQGLTPNQKDSNENTPLHLACAYGSYFCVKILLDSGANVNALNEFKLSAFALAYLKGHLGICDLLDQYHKFDVNLKHEFFNDQNLMMISLVNNHLSQTTYDQIAYLISKHKATCKQIDLHGNNCLHHLAANNSSDEFNVTIAKLLVENGCDIVAINNKFEIPLFNAINSGNVKYSIFLIENSRDVNYRKFINLNGESILHVLCKNISLAPILWPFLNKLKDQFEFMASLEDLNGQIPLVVAIKSVKKLKAVPLDIQNFIIRTLFIDLKSDLNKRELIFDLIDDNLSDLFEFILRESQFLYRKIDFSQEDSMQYNCLGRAIQLKQVKIAEIIINHSLCSLTKVTSMMNESPLQLAIRHKQFSIFNLILKQLSPTDLRGTLLHYNTQAQNIFHVLASTLKTNEERAHFYDFFDILSSVPLDTLQKLVSSKDINARTPLHLATINRSYLNMNKCDMSIENYFINIAGHECCLKKDKYMRLPIHYLFLDNIENESTETDLKLKSMNEIIAFESDPIELFDMMLTSQNGKLIHDKDIYGYSPLHYAVLSDSYTCCERLIETDFKIITSNNCQAHFSQNTPLSSAVYYKRKSITKLFLNALIKNTSATRVLNETHGYCEESSDVNEKCLIKWKISNETSIFKEIQLIELIIRHNWFDILSNIILNRDKFGLSPFDLIVSSLNSDNFLVAYDMLVRFLQDESICSKIGDGRTLLHIICLKSAKSKLLAQMANKLLSSKSSDFLLKEKDYFQCAPLHYACLNHNFEIIDLLLRYDSNLAESKDSHGHTPLSLLFWNIGQIDFTDKIKTKILVYVKDAQLKAHYPLNDPLSLKSHNEYPLLKQPESQQIHPFLFAINQQDLSMIEFFINHLKVDVNLSDAHNVPAVVYAIRVNNIKIVRLLFGIDPNSVSDDEEIRSNINLFHLDSDSRSIFHHLALSLEQGSFVNRDILNLIINAKKKNENDDIELKCYLNKPDNKSFEPLHYALKHGNIDLINGNRVLSDTFFGVNDESYDILHAIQTSASNSNENSEEMDTSESLQVELTPLVVSPILSLNSKVVVDQETKIPFDCNMHKFEFTMGYYEGHNTFLKMQLLSRASEIPMFIIYTKMGKVNHVNDDHNAHTQEFHFHSLEDAKIEFYKLFSSKTGNSFVEVVLKRTKKFEYKHKKFYLIDPFLFKTQKFIEKEYKLPLRLEQMKQAIDQNETINSKILNNEVYNLFFDFIDVECFKRSFYENTNISRDHLSISSLERSTLDACEAMLKNDLKDLIQLQLKIVAEHRREDQNKYHQIVEEINKKSYEFYSKIPLHEFKFEKFQPISNHKLLNANLALIDKLKSYHHTMRVLMGAYESMKSINPIDYVYKSLACKIDSLKANDWETNILLKYCLTTSSRSTLIEKIFKIEQTYDNVKNFGENSKNRSLLYAYGEMDQVLSILSNQINLSKANYLILSDSFEMVNQKNKGFVLVFETSLGQDGEYSAMKVNGQYEPSEQYTIYLPNGCKVPLGLPILKRKKAQMKYNQYMVYDKSSICLRYLIKYRNENYL